LVLSIKIKLTPCPRHMSRCEILYFYFFFLKIYNLARVMLMSCHMAVYNHDTWQCKTCFQFILLSKIFLFNLVPLLFKMIQFFPFRFESKLVNKLNYSLYIHVTIFFFNIYIKSLQLNTQIILFFTFLPL